MMLRLNYPKSNTIYPFLLISVPPLLLFISQLWFPRLPSSIVVFFALIVLIASLFKFKKKTSLDFCFSVTDLYIAVFSFFLCLSFFVTLPTKVSFYNPLGPLFFTVLLIIYLYLKNLFKEFNYKQYIILISIWLAVFLSMVLWPFSMTNPNRTNNSFFLPNSLGWEIATDTIKNPSNLLFGVGAGNFPLYLAKFRPLPLSTVSMVGVNIQTESNIYLQLLVEYGLISLIMFLAVIFSAFRSLLTDVYVDFNKYRNIGFNPKSLADFLPFLSMLVFLLFSIFHPPSVLILYFWITLISLIRLREEKIYKFDYKIKSNTAKVLFAVGIFTTVLFLYSFGKVSLANLYYQLAVKSQKNNITLKTYGYIFSAISLNRKDPAFHNFLAKISLSSAKQLSRATNRTQDDTRKMEDLFSQAVSESNQAIILVPNNPDFHANLGLVFLDGLSVIPGATESAVMSLQKAVNMDYRNPLYHLALGRAYLEQARPDLAQRQFEASLSLDPGQTNVYVYLYISLRRQGLTAPALEVLKTAKNTVAPNSPNDLAIDKEIKSLESPAKPAESNFNQILNNK